MSATPYLVAWGPQREHTIRFAKFSSVVMLVEALAADGIDFDVSNQDNYDCSTDGLGHQTVSDGLTADERDQVEEAGL